MSAATALAGLSAIFNSNLERPPVTAIGMLIAPIEPMTIITNHRLSAMRMAISGQLASMLSKPRRRTSVVLRKSPSVVGDAGELDLFGHFVQAAPQALADAVRERFLFDRRIVRIVRRE